MGLCYRQGIFFFSANSEQTLAPAVDSRTDTLIDELLPIFKAHARIGFPDDDELCKLYLDSAISRIEQWCMMPIAPRAYNWELKNYSASQCVLPLRNSVIQGEQAGFELLIAPKLIDVPASWPLLIEVGFDSGDDMPSDLKLGIFHLALALYEMRSTPEMTEVYSQNVMNGSLSRYWVPRC